MMRYLFTANSAAEAHMISHLLHNEGINAQVHGDNLIAGTAYMPDSGHIKITVPNVDYDKSMAIIKALEASQPRGEMKPKIELRTSKRELFLAFALGFFLCAFLYAADHGLTFCK